MRTGALLCVGGILVIWATICDASALAETQVEAPLAAAPEPLPFKRNVHAVCANPNISPEMRAFRDRYRRSENIVDSDCPRR